MNTFKKLSRRSVLRGVGVSLSLPLLQGMAAPLAQAATTSASNSTKAPIRMAWVFFPNGTNSRQWLPSGEGKDWAMSPSLEPLASLRDDFLVLRGLAQRNAASLGDGPGDHARSAAAFLTGAHPFKTAGSKIKVGRSVDQVAADACGRETRLPSIELGTEEGRSAGSCDSGYACAYSNNISWRTESQPMAKEINPRMAFERLFGAVDKTSSSKEAQAAHERQWLKKSILDMVNEQAKELRAQVGQEDRRKLEEYYTSIREIELRMERMNKVIDVEKLGGKVPVEKTSDYGEHIRLMFDLMVLAFQADATRLATFMLANEGSNKTFPMIDVKEGHHSLSHHQEKADAMEKIAKIDRYYAEQFAYFIQKLKATPEGESNLLDNSMIVYGGAIGDGNRHNHDDLPIVLAGRAGGYVRPGRLLRYDNVPLNNLFLNMLDLAGAKVDRFGDSTGRLQGLS